MTLGTHHYRLVGCPYCAWRSWYRPDDEDSPRHDCPQGAPQGFVVGDAELEQRLPRPKVES